MRLLIRSILATTLLIVALPTRAQAPSEDWMTFVTDHYRVHFPSQMEAWARKVASRLESVREIVDEKVGVQTDEVIDVLIMDPMATANGSALPLMGRARMVLWASPPDSSSVIGTYTDWADLLTVHEQTHLAHLLIPSRRPLDQILAGWTRLGPLIARSPRWITEGYATVIEGELTGSGRPQSEIRSAILREWASTGRLPTYGGLSSDSRRYLGMSMAYLAGSAYLEWLQDREGPDSLKKLWRRMSARQERSFSEAFRGVFGESPETLYARFGAELTHEALSLEEKLGPAVQGEEWQTLTWSTSAPDVSPDGSKITLIARDREAPSKLVVWETAPSDEARKQFDERIEKILERDPLDVAPVVRHPFARKPVRQLEAPEGVELYSPRWIDEDEIVFVRFEPDAHGFVHPDLFLWKIGEPSAERVTFGDDLRDPAPVAGTREVVAVRNRNGFSQLVRASLDTGEVGGLTEPSIDVVYSAPRVSADGSRLAFVLHREGSWHLMTSSADLTGVEEVGLPEGTTVVGPPEWSPDGDAIYASLGRNGFIEIYKLDATGPRRPRLLTRSLGASLSPAAGKGGQIFFLALDPDGLDLHSLNLEESPTNLELPEDGEALARPPVAEPPALEIRDPGEPRPYGWGNQEWTLLSGGGRAAGQESFEAGVRIGDVLGRLETMILGSWSNGRAEGGVIMATTRRWPIALSGRVYSFTLEPSLSPDETALTIDLEEKRTGVEALGGWGRVWRDGGLDVRGGALLEDRTSPVLDDRTVWKAFGQLEGRRQWSIVGLTSSASANVGVTTSDQASALSGAVAFGAGLDSIGLRFGARRVEIDGAEDPRDLVMVGGLHSALEPVVDRISRIDDPALPFGSLMGDRYEGLSVEIRTNVLPLRPFWSAHRAWMAGLERPDWIELAGLRASVGIPSLPIIAFPSARLDIGAAQRLTDGPADDIEWWLNVRWGD